MPSTVLIAVQIEGPRFSTRISVGDRPSEKTPFCFGRVTGVSFGTWAALGEALDAMGFAWDAFRTARVGNRTRFVCRQRCMNSSALLGAAILPFMMDQVYRGRVPWSVISAFTCRSLQANLTVKLSHAKGYQTYLKARLLANVGGPISPNRPTSGHHANTPNVYFPALQLLQLSLRWNRILIRRLIVMMQTSRRPTRSGHRPSLPSIYECHLRPS
jgi:hypothetical protein